ncbi:MAG: hypothetical protein H7Y15_02040, partial [Pseudonocardia sp.]|nr:hypothetical protein [Pseudonocardia sp.]
ELRDQGGFSPIVIGQPLSAADPLNPDKPMVIDSIGIVTIHDGPSLVPGEIIAPAVGNDSADINYHNNYQDPDAFLRAGGRRGRQYVPLTDGTYFLNRWFATVEVIPKTLVPIGYVGVVVSYYGPIGADISGDAFRHGERVARGERDGRHHGTPARVHRWYRVPDQPGDVARGESGGGRGLGHDGGYGTRPPVHKRAGAVIPRDDDPGRGTARPLPSDGRWALCVAPENAVHVEKYP